MGVLGLATLPHVGCDTRPECLSLSSPPLKPWPISTAPPSFPVCIWVHLHACVPCASALMSKEGRRAYTRCIKLVYWAFDGRLFGNWRSTELPHLLGFRRASL